MVDLGDRVVMRPVPDDAAIADLKRKYADRGPDTSAARRAARRADAASARQRA
jgi:hypothetical protein